MPVELSPEKAIDHLDGVAKKYQGTRDDHFILSASVQIIRNVISEWRAMQDAPLLEEVPRPQSKSNGKQRSKRN
jgi:hypothetical protein